MASIPRFATWEAFNAHLEDQCSKRQSDVLRSHAESIGERLARDLAVMAEPPAAPFDTCDQATERASPQALVRYKTNASSARRPETGLVLRRPVADLLAAVDMASFSHSRSTVGSFSFSR